MKYSIGDIARMDTETTRKDCNGSATMLSSVTRVYFKVIAIRNGEYKLSRFYYPSIIAIECGGILWSDCKTFDSLSYKYEGTLGFAF